MIKREGKKWVVYSEKGKHLGTYYSRGEAQHRLMQVEYFKHHPQKK